MNVQVKYELKKYSFGSKYSETKNEITVMNI